MKKISAFVCLGLLAANGCMHRDSHASNKSLNEPAGSEVNRTHDNGSVGVHTSTETDKAYNRDNERSVDSSDKR